MAVAVSITIRLTSYLVYGYIFEPMASIMAVSSTMIFQVYGSTAASDSMRSESEVFFSRLVIIETSVLVEELLSLGLLVR